MHELPEFVEDKKLTGVPEDTIRDAYARVSGDRHNIRVRLSDLRLHLSEYSRVEQDDMINEMDIAGKLVLMPLDDPQETYFQDQEAAIDIAGSKRHIVYMREKEQEPSDADDPTPVVSAGEAAKDNQMLKPTLLDTVNQMLTFEKDKSTLIKMALNYSASQFKAETEDAELEIKAAMQMMLDAQDRLNQLNLAKEIQELTTNSTNEEVTEFSNAYYDSTQVISAGQAREWYKLARQKGDQPLVDRIQELGRKLHQHYNKEQEQEGEEPLKPPPEYSHPTVTVTLAEHRQIETDLSVGQNAMTPKPQSQRHPELAL